MWIGACTSSIGTWMQSVAQSWLGYEMSKNNPRYLAIDSFLGQIPIVVLALLSGVVADRRSRRHILLTSQYIQMTCAFPLATLYFTGVLQVWQGCGLSFIVGNAQAFRGPAYPAPVPTFVPNPRPPHCHPLYLLHFKPARL